MTTSKNDALIPDDYKDFIYRITYLFLGKFAGYVPRSIRPNQITAVAFISAMLGAFLLVFVQSPAAFLYWTLFNFIWYLLDALDGIHARLTGQTSEYGAFLDHALDNIYFIFMFTAFAWRFDLGHVFYIYVLLARCTAALMVFAIQYHTKRFYLSRFSGGTEFLLFSLAMFLSYCYPNFNPAYHTSNTLWLYFIHVFSLQQGMFMKLVLMIYAVGAPVNFILQFRFAKKELLPQK